MIFANPWVLLGLAAVLGPIVLHLLKRRAATPVRWGAMRFLMDTVSVRRRRIEWEDMVLMMARCLLLALLVLAVARPLVPPGSMVPWRFLLPLVLLGIAGFGASFVLRRGKRRWVARGIAIALLLLAAGLVVFEQRLNLRRFQGGGGRDIALVIDGSTSMNLGIGTATSFAQAIAEAKGLVNEAPPGTAFAVILGGAAPEMVTGSPLSRREDVLQILDELVPVGGTFRVREALGLATLALAEGTNDGKEIVVFTDPQRQGWNLENAGAWGELAETWETLGTKPRVMVRTFDAPGSWRNVALGEVTLSREVVGTDRDVAIQARVVNTGTEAVTPAGVTVTVAGEALPRLSVGLLEPGESRLVSVRHRFPEPGAVLVELRLEVEDDLAADNVGYHTVAVREPVRVRVVEGRRGGNFMERAGSMLALALSPRGDEGETAMEVEIVPAAELVVAGGWEDVDVLVLADVVRLPPGTIEQVSGFVSGGGGLWVVAGPRVEPSFYNEWESPDGPVMPVDFGEMREAEEPVGLAMESLDHPALQLFREVEGDLGEGTVFRYRRMEPRGASVAGRLANGEPFFAAKQLGRGRVLVTAGGLDAGSGTVAGRRAFVPMVHQWAGWLAAAGRVDPNVRSGWRPVVALGGGGGLKGEYFVSPKQGPPVVTRLDPNVDFTWGDGSPAEGVPADNFIVEWSGTLTPPETGRYRFELAADDSAAFYLNDRRRIENGGEYDIDLVAGEPVEVEVRFRERHGGARVSWTWRTPSDRSRRPVPRWALTPPGEMGANERAGTTARDDRGRDYPVRIATERGGHVMEILAPARPGVFEVAMTPELRTLLPWVASDAFPVAVSADTAESRFAPLTPEDREFLSRRIDLLEPGSVEEMAGVLAGRAFGRELWRMLAVAALALLLLETALGRWISVSRRIGADDAVAFGEQNAHGVEMAEMLKRTREGAR